MRLYTLITCRHRAGMSQKDLAKIIKVHWTLISRYECGKSSPTLKRFKAISQALDMTGEEILAVLRETKIERR